VNIENGRALISTNYFQGSQNQHSIYWTKGVGSVLIASFPRSDWNCNSCWCKCWSCVDCQ
jgi:hypothetical protein